MRATDMSGIPTLGYDVGFHGSSHMDSTIDPITVVIAVAIALALHSSPAK